MLQSLKDRFKSYQHVWKQGDWTFFRLYKFFISAKGRKKVQYMLVELLRSVFKWKTNEEGIYQKWFSNQKPSERTLNTYKKEIENWVNKPLLTVILLVKNSNDTFLAETLRSLQHQVYTNWEVILVSENVEGNEHIQEQHHSLQKAIHVSQGEWIVTVAVNDVLTEDAFYHIVKLCVSDSVDVIYTDEDRISEKEALSHHFFKPKWSPDTLLARNYIGDFVVYRKSLLQTFLNESALGSDESFDLLLQATEQTALIKHISKILVHKRVSVAVTDVQIENRKAVIVKALERRGENGTVVQVVKDQLVYSIRYDIKQKAKVSIIIPTKNKADILGVCLDSIFSKSTYSNFEVIVLDNNSDEAEFFTFIEEWKLKEPTRLLVHRVEKPFNFSFLMNEGERLSSGEYLLLLNNDTEVLSEDWLEVMLEQAQRPNIGVVGARLLFPNNTLQHGGMIVGLGGIAAEHIYLGASVTETGYHYNLKATTNYSALTAACFMCRKAVFNEMGGFDEQLEVECNDVDFCLRVHESGYKNVYLPHVELYHYESISRGHPMKTKESYAKHMKEINYFRSKWMAYIDNDPYYNPNLSLESNQFKLNLNSTY